MDKKKISLISQKCQFYSNMTFFEKRKLFFSLTYKNNKLSIFHSISFYRKFYLNNRKLVISSMLQNPSQAGPSQPQKIEGEKVEQNDYRFFLLQQNQFNYYLTKIICDNDNSLLFKDKISEKLDIYTVLPIHSLSNPINSKKWNLETFNSQETGWFEILIFDYFNFTFLDRYFFHRPFRVKVKERVKGTPVSDMGEVYSEVGKINNRITTLIDNLSKDEGFIEISKPDSILLSKENFQKILADARALSTPENYQEFYKILETNTLKYFEFKQYEWLSIKDYFEKLKSYVNAKIANRLFPHFDNQNFKTTLRDFEFFLNEIEDLSTPEEVFFNPNFFIISENGYYGNIKSSKDKEKLSSQLVNFFKTEVQDVSIRKETAKLKWAECQNSFLNLILSPEYSLALKYLEKYPDIQKVLFPGLTLSQIKRQICNIRKKIENLKTNHGFDETKLKSLQMSMKQLDVDLMKLLLKEVIPKKKQWLKTSSEIEKTTIITDLESTLSREIDSLFTKRMNDASHNFNCTKLPKFVKSSKERDVPSNKENQKNQQTNTLQVGPSQNSYDSTKNISQYLEEPGIDPHMRECALALIESPKASRLTLKRRAEVVTNPSPPKNKNKKTKKNHQPTQDQNQPAGSTALSKKKPKTTHYEDKSNTSLVEATSKKAFQFQNSNSRLGCITVAQSPLPIGGFKPINLDVFSVEWNLIVKTLGGALVLVCFLNFFKKQTLNLLSKDALADSFSSEFKADQNDLLILEHKTDQDPLDSKIKTETNFKNLL